MSTTKTFKEYYNNPEFKEKHNKYIREKIMCEDCKKDVQRVAMAKHKRTKKHLSCCEKNKTTNIKDMVDELVKQRVEEIMKTKSKSKSK